jgi:hypothetical protein
MAGLEQLIQEANALPQVSLRASTAYHARLKEMTSFVDEGQSSHPAIQAQS